MGEHERDRPLSGATGADSAAATASNGIARRETAAAWAIGLCGVALSLLVSRGQMAGGPDAVTYLSTAESLRAGEGLGNWLEHPMVTFPPAWPAAIALLMLLGLSADVAATVLVAIALLVTPRLVLALMRAATDSPTARLLGVVAVGLSPVLVPWSYLALSEVPFCTITLGAAVLAIRSRQPRLGLPGRADAIRGDVALVGAIALSALAPLIRYAGLAVPVALAVWIALDRERSRRWFASAAALVAGLVPLGIVMARNVSLVDSPLGERQPSSLNVLQVAQQGAVTMGRTAVWTLDAAPEAPSLLLGLVVIAATAWVSLRRGASEPDGGRSARLLLGLIAGVQWAVLVAGRTRAEIDDLDGRLLSLTAVLVVLLGMCLAGDLLESPTPVVRRLTLVAAVGWCVIGVLALGRGVVTSRDGVGYTSDRWSDVRELTELAQIPAGCRRMEVADIEDPERSLPACGVLANDVWGWYGSELSPLMTPRRLDAEDDLGLVRRAVEQGSELYVVWTTVNEPYGYLVPEAQLDEELGLEVIGAGDDVTLYRVVAG